MSLNRQTTEQVAQLARLQFDDASLDTLTSELSAIVDFVEQLAEVNTDGVEPLANVAGLHSVTRPDVVGDMLSNEQVLANAPQNNDGSFLVPKAVGANHDDSQPTPRRPCWQQYC